MSGARAGQMTSRERVRATVAGQPVDAVPVMTWLNPHAACRIMAELHPASDRERTEQAKRIRQQGVARHPGRISW